MFALEFKRCCLIKIDSLAIEWQSNCMDGDI